MRTEVLSCSLIMAHLAREDLILKMAKIIAALLAGTRTANHQFEPTRRGDAHEAQAHAVKADMSHNMGLSELSLESLQGFHPKTEKDVCDVLSLRGSLNARNTLGGTAPVQVRAQIQRHRLSLSK